MFSSTAALASSATFHPDGLLLDLLAVSLTGVNVLHPVYDHTGELVDFAVDYLNPAGQRMTGLPERPGGTLLTHFPHTLTAGILAYYRRVYEAGATEVYEANYQADGLDNYFRLAARRSGDYLLVSFTDTSDQDRSAVEQALRQSQAAEQAARRAAEHQRNELQRYVQQASVAVVVYRGPEYRIAVANAAALAIWDRSWEQVRQRPVFEVLPEAAQPNVVAFFHQVFTTGEPYVAHELPTQINRHGQRQTVYWNFVFQPERQPDGHISGIITIGTEVTEQVLARRQLEQLNAELELRVTARSAETRAALFEAEQQREQLRRQRALLDQILRQVPAAIATMSGPEHRYTFFNDPYQALSAHRTALGQRVVEVFPEVEEQGFIALLDQVFHTGQPFVGTDTPARLHNAATGQAEQRYVDFLYQPLFEGQPQPQGILAFIVDVTEKVLARQQVQQLNQELTAANEELAQTNQQLTRTNVDLDTFVYTASHDLKAPITNLEGLLSALLEQLPAAVQAEPLTAQLLGMMGGAVERFRTTIDQLTDLSRLQRTYDQPAERVALAPVVEAVRLDLLPLLTSTNAYLEVSVSPELAVLFPPKSLRSVVANLLSNALKYHHPGRPPVVLLRAARQAQQVMLTVTDNGLGLSELQQRQLFGLFQRLHTHVEGTGVGLYMIKRLLENSGGTIAVESQAGEGSTFIVTLPF